jgi:hypothetical protein
VGQGPEKIKIVPFEASWGLLFFSRHHGASWGKGLFELGQSVVLSNAFWLIPGTLR